MKYQFIRRYKLTIGEAGGVGAVITDHQIEFRITQPANSKLNQIDLKIYNLPKSTIALFDKEDVVVTLEVGYRDGPLITVFGGNKTWVSSKRESTEIVTRVLAAEGVVAVREGRVNFTLEEGVSVRRIIEKIATSGLGSSVQFSNESIGNKIHEAGYSYSGSAKKAMDDICGVNNLRWKISGSAVSVYPANAENNKVAVVINSSIIKNTPEKISKEVAELRDDAGLPPKTGLTITTMLNPLLKTGGVVKVEGTLDTDGIYLIEEVTHSGSYEGDEWDTNIDCVQSTFVEV